jgi:phospholipid/cholesterol/gamma-HCH transport system permease protein
MIGLLGRSTRLALRRGSDFLGMLALLVTARLYPAHASRRRIFHTLYRRQLYYTGVQGIWVVGAIAALFGALLAYRLPRIAPNEPIGPAFAELFITVMVRALAPLMTAIVVIARSGTAVTAKIGYLKMFREFEVLRAMGIDPVHLFLVPVFFAFPVSVLVLVVYFDVVSMAAAVVTLWVQDSGIDPAVILANVLNRLDATDLAVIVSKCLLTGLIVGIYSIYHGAHLERSLVGVARGMSVSTSRQLLLVVFAQAGVSLIAYSR